MYISYIRYLESYTEYIVLYMNNKIYMFQKPIIGQII